MKTRGHVVANIDNMSFDGALRPLIEGLHFEVKPGTIAAFIGASGAGKTTLLRILAGFERNYAGSVTVDGRSVTGAGRERQMVFQDTRLFPWMTALQNVAFACKDREGSARFDLARHWLDRVGLNDRVSAWPHALSGGEKSRVALARSLVDPPALLLLDEPLTGLDVGARLLLIDLIAKFSREIGFTSIFVSHETHDAVLLADEVFVVAAKPLRIQHRVMLPDTRPREFGGEAVLTAMNEIRSALLASTSGLGRVRHSS